ncbi:MAG TPA: hypothetical protein VNE62_12965, partial [Actinomycetota bacterium]|nr:hypothetical protein [Actinomycetota bacterium]
AAARTIEDLEPDRQDELAARLANHRTEAGEPARSARWQTRAAAWAGVNDPEASLRHWWAAREQMSAIPEGQERDRLALDSCVGILNSGSRLGVSVEQSAQLLEEGRLLAERLGDTRSLAQLLLVYARARGQAGAVEEALEHSLAAATLAERTGLRGLRMAAAVNLSIWHWQMGRLDESVQAADSALVRVPSDLRIGSEHLGYSPYIWLVMQRGRVLPWLGRFAEAERELDRAVGLATEHEEMEILCWAHQGHCDLAWLTGDARSAIANARQAVRIADKLQTRNLQWSSYYALGRAYLLSGDAAPAAQLLSRALEVIRETGVGRQVEALILSDRAEAKLALGQVEVAERIARSAVQLSRARGLGTAQIRSRLSLVRALLRRDPLGDDSLAEAEVLVREALDLVESTKMRVLEPLVRLELAEVAKRRPDEEAGERELSEARRLFEELGAHHRAREAAPAG